MEDPPTLLTRDDGAGKILLRGLIDWVSLDEARWLVSLAEPGAPSSVREATLRNLKLLVDRDLVRLGDLTPRFEPWAMPAADALQRVRREWWDPEKELHPGSIVWIDNTPAGDEVARSIESAQQG